MVVTLVNLETVLQVRHVPDCSGKRDSRNVVKDLSVTMSPDRLLHCSLQERIPFPSLLLTSKVDKKQDGFPDC